MICLVVQRGYKLTERVKLTTIEAAELLGIKPKTLTKMRAEGKSPPYVQLRDYGKVFYYLDDVEKFIEVRTKNRGAEG